MMRAILNDYGKLVLRFLKDYGVFHVWQCDVVDSPLTEERKTMSAPQILEQVSIERLDPIMNGIMWHESTYGVVFWLQCQRKWAVFLKSHINDF